MSPFVGCLLGLQKAQKILRLLRFQTLLSVPVALQSYNLSAFNSANLTFVPAHILYGSNWPIDKGRAINLPVQISSTEILRNSRISIILSYDR